MSPLVQNPTIFGSLSQKWKETGTVLIEQAGIRQFDLIFILFNLFFIHLFFPGSISELTKHFCGDQCVPTAGNQKLLVHKYINPSEKLLPLIQFREKQ